MAKNKKTSEKIKLDQIMKILFKISKKLTINLLNGLFDENFKPNEVTIEYSNREFVDDDYQRIRGDLFINVRANERIYSYHIEFQTLNDTGMIIRMFRYGFEKAREVSDATGVEEIRLEFPKQLVIFIEENENISDQLSMTIILPDNQEVKYTVPVMKYWKYTPEELVRKKMYSLLPLQVFNSRKKIESIYSSNRPEKEKAYLINEEFNNLKDTVKNILDIVKKLHDEKEISVKDLTRMLDVLTNITDYIYSKYGEYQKIDEEVTHMIRTLYDPAVKEEGIKEGIEKGMEKGKIDTVLKMIRKRYGNVPNSLLKDIKSADMDTLDMIIEGIMDDKSLEEIKAILK